MKLGDKVVWYGSLDDPNSVRQGTVTKIQPSPDYKWGYGPTSCCWVDNHHKPEDCLYKDYAWPAAFADELAAVVAERARLKRAYDDSMSLIYQLKNKISLATKG